MRRTALLACLTIIVLISSPLAWAAELHVMNSGGFSAAYKALAPTFEKSTGNTLATAWGPSMGATPEALKQVLLNARSIAYSDSASGVYIERELFKKLGVEAQVRDKARMVPKVPVAGVVASGEYEIGFQQVSELLPVAGADFVGKIPESLQSVTVFAAGIPVGSRHPEEARQLIRFLASPQAEAEVRNSGLDPLSKSK